MPIKIIFYLVFGERISQICTYFLFFFFPFSSSSLGNTHRQGCATSGGARRRMRRRRNNFQPMGLDLEDVDTTAASHCLSPPSHQTWERREAGEDVFDISPSSKKIYILIGKRVLWQIHTFLPCPSTKYQFLPRVSKRCRRSVMFRGQFCLTLSVQSSNTNPKSVHVPVSLYLN